MEKISVELIAIGVGSVFGGAYITQRVGPLLLLMRSLVYVRALGMVTGRVCAAGVWEARNQWSNCLMRSRELN